jgi:hypothetical protein
MFVIQELFRQFHIPAINRVFKNFFEGKGTDGMINLPLSEMFLFDFFFFFFGKIFFFFNFLRVTLYRLSACFQLSFLNLL